MSNVTPLRPSLCATLLASSVLVVTLLRPSPADACSRALVVMAVTYPERGAVHVPTNAVPFVYGFDLDSASVALFDEKDELVPVEARAAGPGFDLVPLNELEPNHRYELRALSSEVPESIEFNTGPGPAALPEHLEQPTLDVHLLEYTLGNCGEVSGLCVEADQPADTILELRVGDEVLSASADTMWPVGSGFGDQPMAGGECVEVRVRDVRGNRSEPTVVCDEALQRVRLIGDTGGYTCDNYAEHIESEAAEENPQDTNGAESGRAVEPSDDEPSCALGRSNPLRSNYGFVVLGVAAVLAARRRAAS